MLWWPDSTRRILNSMLVVRMYTCTCKFLFYLSLSYAPLLPLVSIIFVFITCTTASVSVRVLQVLQHVICHCTFTNPKHPSLLSSLHVPFHLFPPFPPISLHLSLSFFLLPLKLSGLLSCFVPFPPFTAYFH